MLSMIRSSFRMCFGYHIIHVNIITIIELKLNSIFCRKIQNTSDPENTNALTHPALQNPLYLSRSKWKMKNQQNSNYLWTSLIFLNYSHWFTCKRRSWLLPFQYSSLLLKIVLPHVLSLSNKKKEHTISWHFLCNLMYMQIKILMNIKLESI